MTKQQYDKQIEILILPFFEINKSEENEAVIDFSEYKIDAFSEIEDPVEWQNEIRSEWNK